MAKYYRLELGEKEKGAFVESELKPREFKITEFEPLISALTSKGLWVDLTDEIKIVIGEDWINYAHEVMKILRDPKA
jgi:hypothetical protein